MAHNHSGGGGFIGSPGGGAAIAAGGELFGGLARLIGGPTESQKRSRSLFDLIKNRLGQTAFDPNQSLAAIMQSLAPQFNRQAEGINRRLGLDSGVAQGELARGQQSTLSGILAQFQQFAAGLQVKKDSSNLGILSRLTASV